MSADWRQMTYGRISGGQLEACLQLFKTAWADRNEWSQLDDPEAWVRSVEKLATVRSWTPLYQLSLAQLIAMMGVVTGTLEEIKAAAADDNPVDRALELFSELPDEAPDHPDAMPVAFAMAGNLDAIARYSRTVNDMIRACSETGDIGPMLDALSVDSTISTMPFFQAAMRLGQLSEDHSFATAVFKAIQGPHRKRLIYPELRWAEYLLRDQGAFEACTREQIYELVAVHLKLYDPAGIHLDPKAALFTLFRSWQKEAGIQKPRFGFSGKE